MNVTDAPVQSSEWFECDRPGCDTVMGSVGDPDPEDDYDPFGDYDPIGEHIAQHEYEDQHTEECIASGRHYLHDGVGACVCRTPATGAQLERGNVVCVIAERLSNGAPNPYFGRTGVVSEVRPLEQQWPVRVQVAGRAVMFALAELMRDDDAGVGGTRAAWDRVERMRV